MEFIATFEHTADNCWARPENEELAEEWIETMEDRAAENDVNLRGAYVSPNEHRFYFVVGADSLEDVTAFFGPPFLHDHDGDVAPVMTMGEAVDTLSDDED